MTQIQEASSLQQVTRRSIDDAAQRVVSLHNMAKRRNMPSEFVADLAELYHSLAATNGRLLLSSESL